MDAAARHTSGPLWAWAGVRPRAQLISWQAGWAGPFWGGLWQRGAIAQVGTFSGGTCSAGHMSCAATLQQVQGMADALLASCGLDP